MTLRTGGDNTHNGLERLVDKVLSRSPDLRCNIPHLCRIPLATRAALRYCASMRVWHFRYARGLIYIGAFAAIAGIVVSAKWGEHNLPSALISTRQFFGLWAFGFLIASMLLGPLTFVLPWIPLRTSLMYGRRAVGVSALLFAVLHVASYFWSVLRRNWREIYTPGTIWFVGLVLGIFALIILIALGFTSRDSAVKRMGGRKWKKLHRTVRIALLLVLIHAIFVGADFGFNHAPDLKGDADFGCLFAFTSLAVAWAILSFARHRGWRWTPTMFSQKTPILK